MTEIKKEDRFIYEIPEIIEIDLLHEEDVAKGAGSNPDWTEPEPG